MGGYQFGGMSTKDIGEYEGLFGYDWAFCFGEGEYIADGVIGGVKKFIISPRLDDYESILNAMIMEKLGIGIEVGQIEKMGKYGVDQLREAKEIDILDEYEYNEEGNRMIDILEAGF